MISNEWLIVTLGIVELILMMLNYGAVVPSADMPYAQCSRYS